MEVIADLVVRMARDNPRWGYTRIQGALYNVGHRVGRTTVADILKRNGIDPAPERGKRTTWSQFLKAHWDVLAAADFFTVEVWGRAAHGTLVHANRRSAENLDSTPYAAVASVKRIRLYEIVRDRHEKRCSKHWERRETTLQVVDVRMFCWRPSLQQVRLT
jgi:hypothetical protein